MKRIKTTVEQYVKEQGIAVTICEGIHVYGTTPQGNWFNLAEAGCDGYFCLTVRSKERNETVLRKSRLLLTTAIKQIKAN